MHNLNKTFKCTNISTLKQNVPLTNFSYLNMYKLFCQNGCHNKKPLELGLIWGHNPVQSRLAGNYKLGKCG